jgi:hypothetical protein
MIVTNILPQYVVIKDYRELSSHRELAILRNGNIHQ